MANETDHVHCSHCVNMIKCRAKGGGVDCPFITCRLGCGRTYHACKDDEHKLLCFEEKIPCVNKYYGCTKIMKRSDIGSHIARCPASVVYCSATWIRHAALFIHGRFDMIPLNKPVKLPTEDQLSISQVVSDEKKIRAMLQCKDELYHHTVDDMFNLKVHKVFNKSICESLDTRSKRWLESVRCKCFDEIEKKYNLRKFYKSGDCAANTTFCTVAYEERMQPVPNDFYESFSTVFLPRKWPITVVCAAIIQREAYSSHYNNVHHEIQGSSDGWLEQYCPLRNMGCQYSQHRFYPNSPTNKVIFNTEVDGYCVKFMYDAIQNVNHGPIFLENLPVEILINIFEFLDNVSIINISLTCSHLRSVCSTMVKHKGIVVQDWHASPCSSRDSMERPPWKVANKKWQFTKSFVPILKWGFNNVPHMANHLKTCEFNKRLIRKEPWHLPYYGMPADPDLAHRLLPVSGTATSTHDHVENQQLITQGVDSISVTTGNNPSC